MNRQRVLDAAAVIAARDAVARSRPDWPAPVLPETTGSTNADLARQEGAAHLAVVASLGQQAAKGRLDRDWVAPPGACLGASFLLRPPADVPMDALGFSTVLVALAAARTIERLAGAPAAGIKWPNDLLVQGRKVAGILARLAPSGSRGPEVVVGIGLNLNQSREELPVGTATSLAMAGIDVAADQVLGTLWGLLADLVDDFFAAGGDVTRPLAALDGVGVLAAARAASSTLGSDVRVHLPGGAELVGVAVDLDADGCLVVAEPSGERHHVHAGDVVHLRRSDGGYA